MLVAAVVALPLALAWGLLRTEVEATVGTAPVTLTPTVSGTSELRLGLAGTIYVPQARGPLGLSVAVDGPGDPGAGSGDLADYVSPAMLRLYTGLFRDPAAAVDGYVDLVTAELRRQVVTAEVVLALVGGTGAWLLGGLLPRRREVTRRGLRTVGAVGLALVTTTGLAVVAVRGEATTAGSGTYPLTALRGTALDGSTTDSPIVRAIAGGALRKSQALLARQEERAAQFRADAIASVEAQTDLMDGPREGETAVLVQSDMHCNTTMIAFQRRVVELLREQHGGDVPALMAVTGDLTTNGTAAERTCIDAEAGIAGDAPVVAVTGNHESGTSEDQMRDAGMTVLDGDTATVGGVRVLGDGDPARSELFGDTRLRGTETQAEVGARLRGVAEDAGDDRPSLLLVHEAYAAAGFLDVDDVRPVLADAYDLETSGGRLEPDADPDADGVPDVPAGVVLYGHWHRDVPPRLLTNSDGTWSLLMELDTSGGAIDEPTISSFSVPWGQPQQSASFPVLFLDDESGLVTGYQRYTVDTDATVTVSSRVEVGPVTGLPESATS
ncbi:MAG: hypothetical protein CMH83_23520 [Nocardioides sp.]|nr:hypothetical protein [Nocardioides sp.]